MNAEIISVSSNPFALAKGFDIERFRKELEVLSVQLKEQITVGGSPQELVEALASALRHSHIIIVIGAANPSLVILEKLFAMPLAFLCPTMAKPPVSCRRLFNVGENRLLKALRHKQIFRKGPLNGKV